MPDETKETKGTSGERVGVYVCHCGGNISDHVDVERVCEYARKVPGVVTVRDNVFMCSDPGQELIMNDLRNGVIDRVVVASCAPDLHESTFRGAISRAGGNPYIYEHANIREQVSWVHHGEQATGKAGRLVAAAAAKARGLKPLDPFRVDARRHVTVIGGGVAGLKSAIDMADRGLGVTLVEKSPFLGGWTAKWDRVFPTDERAADIVTELARQALNHPSITVHTCSHVAGFEGTIGNFKLLVRREPPAAEAYADEIQRLSESEKEPGEFVPLAGVCPSPIPEAGQDLAIETGMVVLATGFKPYTPRKGEYGFGRFEEVITLPELISTIAQKQEKQAGDDTLMVNGKKIRSMAMIHCVGSRQIPGIHPVNENGALNEYCSRTCCSATLHAAASIREAYPGTRIFDFYRDIRTYGRGHEEIYESASKNKVVFFRFEAQAAPEVSRNDDGGDYPLRVTVVDTLTFGETIQVPVDLVVLAVGMEPNPVSDLVEIMKVPVGTDRFLQEVHPKLRPVEVSVSGILLAGTSQAPFDIGEACAAASAAAVKASATLGRGYVELDPFVAEVDLARCKGTGACVAACLNKAVALTEVEVNGEKVERAQVNPALCSGCGACVAVCPGNAINVKGWTLNQYEDMVDMIVAEQVV